MRARVFIEPQMGATYEQQLAMARGAESAGFDAFFRSDHYLHFFTNDPGPGPTDTMVTLGALARETTTIRLGTLVAASTFRFPGPLAITVAQIDVMSGGRVELGLGAAWNEAEHRAYAIPFPALGERFERLGEQLAILTGLWTTPLGERFEFTGRHYTIEDSPGLPKPVQRPHPPIVVGGRGLRRTPALAARYGQEYNLGFSSAEAAAAAFGRVRSACAEIGRDPSTLRYSVALTTACGAGDAEVRARCARIGRTPEQLRTSGLVGTPAEVVARVAEYAAVGADTVYFQLLDLHDLDHVALLGAEVVPAVTAR